MFQANHEDAYDSDVDEGPNAAVAFMALNSRDPTELDKYNDVNYASKVEIDCAKAKGDLMCHTKWNLKSHLMNILER
ncbi:hypothetical protein Tco_0239546 [Tanacetum coccineum]